MNKTITIEQAIKISEQLRGEGKKIVLAGGCFDILHIGHITFLNKAKGQGDILFVFLENDATVKTLKGNDRPINTQKERAKILASITTVDYVIMLPHFTKDEEYDRLVLRIKPAIIATTKGDKARHHKERQGKLVGSQVVDIIKRISYASTSKLVKILQKEDI